METKCESHLLTSAPPDGTHDHDQGVYFSGRCVGQCQKQLPFERVATGLFLSSCPSAVRRRLCWCFKMRNVHIEDTKWKHTWMKY